MNSHLIRTAAEKNPGPLPLTEDDALVIARSVGGRANDGTRAVYGQVLLPQLPELAASIRTDRWLDVGCGVASATLTMATLYPEMNAVGVESSRQSPPRPYAGPKRMGSPIASTSGRWTCASWTRRTSSAARSGPSRSESTRADTLAVILRALKPGGLLLCKR